MENSELSQETKEGKETELPDNIEIPNNSKKLKIKSDKNNDYEVIFFVHEKLLVFKAYNLNLIPLKQYQKCYKYEDVLHNNKFFKICENINEINAEILSQIEEKEGKAKINENENKLKLIIPLSTKKFKECVFEIDEITNNVNSEINNLYSYINRLLNEINELKEKNKSYEEKLKILENKIDDISLEKLRQKEKKEKKEKELNVIKKWIDPNDEDIKFNLIFKKSRDGNSFEAFHKFCDNKGKTVLLIETTEGRKFGGFTNDSWNNSNEWRTNYNDFVFSLDLNKKYEHSKKGYSTIGDNCFGPVFGNARNNQVDISFEEKTSLNKGISNSSSSFNTNKELNNGKEKFETKELEVYQVIYEDVEKNYIYDDENDDDDRY